MSIFNHFTLRGSILLMIFRKLRLNANKKSQGKPTPKVWNYLIHTKFPPPLIFNVPEMLLQIWIPNYARKFSDGQYHRFFSGIGIISATMYWNHKNFLWVWYNDGYYHRNFLKSCFVIKKLFCEYNSTIVNIIEIFLQLWIEKQKKICDSNLAMVNNTNILLLL